MAPTAPCKFGAKCTRRAACTFKHPDEKKKKAPCMFGVKCRNGVECPFAHPERETTAPKAEAPMEEEEMDDETYLEFMAFEEEMIEAELFAKFGAEIVEVLEQSDDESDDVNDELCELQGERDESADTFVVY